MKIDCPHCHNGIEIVLASPSELVSCPQCGSSFSLLDPNRTASFHEPESKLIGRFRLLDLVGSGSFGDVWKAHDSQLDREVALKLPRKESLTPADIERFIREARVAAQLRHPNVVYVHEVAQADDLVYIVSEFIDGLNLENWLIVHQPDFRRSAQLCATLADALHHAHEEGIVHRDLKPANVLMDGLGLPHLTDFGLAKRDGAEITMTVAGRILGTPAYMSPEQARGDAHDADRRSDVYSLGVMLFEMLVGRRPFLAKGKQMLIEQVLRKDAPSPRGRNRRIPRDLDTICLKALEKDPKRRYQTAKEMGDDLRRFLDGKPIHARRITWAERGWRWTRRNPVVSVLSSTAAVLLLALGLALWRNATLPSQPAVEREREATLRPEMRPRDVTFTTNPPGANVVFVPVNRDTGEPIGADAVRPEGVTPLRAQLRPGRYLVVAVIKGHGFHEVYRTVPGPGETLVGPYRSNSWAINDTLEIQLPSIANIRTPREATREMTLFPGGDFVAGGDGVQASPKVQKTVAPFWLAPTEVTVGDFRAAGVNFSSTLTTRGGVLRDSDPVTFVDYHRASEFAEVVGLRLPTQYEFEFAATAGGTRAFPWGNDAERIKSWLIGAVRTPDFDRANTEPPVFGLYSGAIEWTDSRQDLTAVADPEMFPEALRDQIRNGRIIRGGPASVAYGSQDLSRQTFSAAFRGAFVNERTELPGLGFRCAYSSAPRFQGLAER